MCVCVCVCVRACVCRSEGLCVCVCVCVLVLACMFLLQPVLSWPPQGSVLGPLLFFVCINGLDNNIANHLLKFADDTKLLRKVGSYDNNVNLQDDVDNLVKWSEKWQMIFNFEKCLHLGQNNPNLTYKVSSREIVITRRGKGILFSSKLKVSEQCGIAALKANRILGLTKRNIEHKEKKIYCSII